MTMVSRTALGIAAGIFGTLFVGYCVYFDRQRRKDPRFKEKLRERRERRKKPRGSSEQTVFPDSKNHEAVQMFFLQEVQLGEELLSQGDIEGGVEHLTNAVAVCGQPQQLLQVLQQTLPTNAFQLVIQRLPAVSKALLSAMAQGGNDPEIISVEIGAN